MNFASQNLLLDSKFLLTIYGLCGGLKLEVIDMNVTKTLGHLRVESRDEINNVFPYVYLEIQSGGIRYEKIAIKQNNLSWRKSGTYSEKFADLLKYLHSVMTEEDGASGYFEVEIAFGEITIETGCYIFSRLQISVGKFVPQ